MNIALVVLATAMLLAVVAGWTAHVARRGLLEDLHRAELDLAAVNADVDELDDIVAKQHEEIVTLRAANRALADVHLELSREVQHWLPEVPDSLDGAWTFEAVAEQHPLPTSWDNSPTTWWNNAGLKQLEPAA